MTAESSAQTRDRSFGRPEQHRAVRRERTQCVGARARSFLGARFVLVPAAGGPERTLDLRLGEADVYLLVPGESAEARDLLPAGDWIVRVEGTHWMPTQTRIRLIAGRRLAATVEVRSR